jgi:hypothetical protein
MSADFVIKFAESQGNLSVTVLNEVITIKIKAGITVMK